MSKSHRIFTAEFKREALRLMYQDHLDYGEGWSIWSGQIEGACKNLIGRRLKANAARRRVGRVNRMAGLCSLLDSHQCQTDWETL